MVKYSVGENYRLPPYVVLDYPRQFGKRIRFAFRSMFWWETDSVLRCIFKVEALIMFNDRLHSNLYQLTGKGFYVCIILRPGNIIMEPIPYSLEEYIAKSQSIRHAQMIFFKLRQTLNFTNNIRLFLNLEKRPGNS